MNDAIRVYNITRELLAMVTCTSDSKCVTRLIKIFRDLPRRGERNRKRRTEAGGDDGTQNERDERNGVGAGERGRERREEEEDRDRAEYAEVEEKESP